MKILSTLLALGLSSSFLLLLTVPTQAQNLAQAKPVAASSAELTEASIRQVLSQLEKAEQGEDIVTMMSFVAPFAVSQVTVESDGTRVRRILEGGEDHRQALERSFKRVADRKILENKAQVRISKDGKLAIVTRNIWKEVTTEEKQNFFSFSRDSIHFALVDNQPKIVSIFSDGWLEERP